MITNKLSNLNK